MMDALSLAGAACLTVATLPQAARLLRGGTAAELGWPFVVLNLVGLVALAARSGQIGEWPFFAVNLLGALFWLLVFVVKAMRRTPQAPESLVPQPRIARS